MYKVDSYIYNRPTGWYVYPDIIDNGNSFRGYDISFLKEWCTDNLTGHWDLHYNYLYIEQLEDITLFKLIML